LWHCKSIPISNIPLQLHSFQKYPVLSCHGAFEFIFSTSSQPEYFPPGLKVSLHHFNNWYLFHAKPRHDSSAAPDMPIDLTLNLNTRYNRGPPRTRNINIRPPASKSFHPLLSLPLAQILVAVFLR
jgi:hypothetical protein